MIPANNWIIELQEKYDEVIGFGTLHPEYKDWEKEVERLKRAGIIGLKFHPEFQGFWMDDPRLLPLMEATHKDFIYIFHVGDRAAPKDNPSCPIKLAALARQFPDGPDHRRSFRGVSPLEVGARRACGNKCLPGHLQLAVLYS